MPFLAPFIAAPIAATLGASALATAAIQIGVGVGLSFAARKLSPKQKSSTTQSGGVRVGLQIDTNPDRQWLVGEVATGGSLAYWQLSGADNKTLHMVIALADHECTSLQSVLVNGKPKSWNSTTKQVQGYGDALVVRFYSGAPGQTADAELISTSDGRWAANDVGAGVCYAVVRMTYSEELFPEGIPELGFIVRGAKLYDPRTGTTAWTRNAAVVLWNALRGVSVEGEKLIGMNVPAAAIRLSEAQAAANDCAELIAKKGGGTEARYSCDYVFNTSQSNRDIIETILASMAGELIESGGIYRILAGVARTPVILLTDDDLITSEPLVTRPKRPRNELANAIGGSFTDPARGYLQVALPPRTSSTDEASDGGIRLTKTLDLAAVTSRSQAQRILEIERKRSRRMGSAAMRVRARHMGLEPGDWVTYTSTRRGYDAKVFVVASTSGTRDLQSDIVLTEIDDAIDDWTASTDEIDDNQVIDLASAGPALSEVSGVALVSVTLATSGGVQRPGLQLQWDAITDPTVIELEIQFRKVGDSVALPVPRVLDPSTGSYTWITGVQSGATYEARVRPVTRPARGVTWSAWITSVAATGNQVVPIASLATAVPPNTITPDMLDAQSRFELALVTETDEVLGSVAQQIAALVEASESGHLATINALLDAHDAKAAVTIERTERLEQTAALAQQITTIAAQVGTGIGAALIEEQTARVSADEALSQQITTAVTQLNGNTAAVTALAQSINGIEGRFGVAVNLNGQVIGLVQLDGTSAGSNFVVVANTFRVAFPGVSGGDPVPVFAISSVNGVTKLALRGDMIADGTIVARHLNVVSLSALSANMGTVTAGIMRDPAKKYFFNLTTGVLGTTNNRVKLDLANERFRIGL